jgi:hypothetical protein
MRTTRIAVSSIGTGKAKGQSPLLNRIRIATGELIPRSRGRFETRPYIFGLRGHQIPIVPSLGDRRQAADDFVPVFAQVLAAEDLA